MMTGRSPSLQLTMATPGFKSVAAAVGAARAVRLGRSARSEAAVADFIGKRRAREIVVKVLERRLGDVSESLVREKRLVRGDDHVRLRDKQRESCSGASRPSGPRRTTVENLQTTNQAHKLLPPTEERNLV